MKRQAKHPGGSGASSQHRHRVFGHGAEFARKVQTGAALGQAKPHDQAKIGGPVGLGFDLGQFIGAVEHEVAYAMLVIGFADGHASLDRVHEGDMGLREQSADQSHLGDGGGIEMGDAAGRQRPQNRLVRVAFDGVEDRTGKGLDETRRLGRRQGGAQADHGDFGAVGQDGGIHRR